MSITKQPALFVGHGSPMNAIDSNSFTRMLNGLGQSLPRPRAVLVISAHWMTTGTWVTSMEKPKTIHDFYGFPQALFDVQYPAPGSSEIAKLVQDQVVVPQVLLDDHQWGLDHGTWSVLRHMYPQADIPVLQLSLNKYFSPAEHYKLGQDLLGLRHKGIMIVGSGNIVHNLRLISWDPKAPAYDWALQFDQWVKSKIEARDFEALLKCQDSSDPARLSIPTTEHFDPLYYVLGATDTDDTMTFEYEEIQNASISMRTVCFR